MPSSLNIQRLPLAGRDRSAAARDLDRPIFMIGMPRSGTTLMFAALAAHADLSWFSEFMQRFPAVPGVAALTRAASLTPNARRPVRRVGDPRPFVNRMRVAPSEAWRVWGRCCGDKFANSYLLDVQASPSEARCIRRRVQTTMLLQGKPRFVAKLTGPARIGYLSSVFPEARFVHVIRDPRAVVDSLLRVPFWSKSDRYRRPAWEGGLSDQELRDWERFGTPEALAAVQWGAVLRTAREEASRRDPRSYTEIKYEDFLAEPHAALDRMFAFGGLREDPRAHAFVSERLAIRDLRSAWRDRLSPQQIEIVSDVLAAPLRELGYVDAS